MLDSVKDFLFGDYKIYMFFAVFGSAVAIIQLIITLVFGGFGDVDVDGDGSVEFGEHTDTGFGDFRLLSIRSLVSFFAFFGWGGVIAYEHDLKGLPAFFIALACGAFMMFLTAGLLYFLLKMQHSGNIHPEEYIGVTGSVYLTVPGGRKEIGKATVNVKGTKQEIVIIADEDIDRGESIRVLKKIDDRRFLVEKIT